MQKVFSTVQPQQLLISSRKQPGRTQSQKRLLLEQTQCQPKAMPSKQLSSDSFQSLKEVRNKYRLLRQVQTQGQNSPASNTSQCQETKRIIDKIDNISMKWNQIKQNIGQIRSLDSSMNSQIASEAVQQNQGKQVLHQAVLASKLKREQSQTKLTKSSSLSKIQPNKFQQIQYVRQQKIAQIPYTSQKNQKSIQSFGCKRVELNLQENTKIVLQQKINNLVSKIKTHSQETNTRRPSKREKTPSQQRIEPKLYSPRSQSQISQLINKNSKFQQKSQKIEKPNQLLQYFFIYRNRQKDQKSQKLKTKRKLSEGEINSLVLRLQVKSIKKNPLLNNF